MELGWRVFRTARDGSVGEGSLHSVTPCPYISFFANTTCCDDLQIARLNRLGIEHLMDNSSPYQVSSLSS